MVLGARGRAVRDHQQVLIQPLGKAPRLRHPEAVWDELPVVQIELANLHFVPAARRQAQQATVVAWRQAGAVECVLMQLVRDTLALAQSC